MILTTDGYQENKLVIVRKSGVSFIQLDSIVLIETHDRNTRIVTTEGTYMATQSLKAIEKQLPGNWFFRAHKSFIVNINKIKDIELFTNCTFVVEFNDTKEKAYMTKSRLTKLLAKLKD